MTVILPGASGLTAAASASFNATNDVQLRITMHAGAEPGTTDYVISAYEPQKNYINVYVDNAGSESSGEWREGLFWTDRSLTGSRDMLTMSGMRSDGTKSFSAMYTVPLGRSGTKLGLTYSTNSVKITDGELEDLDIKGHSNAYGVSLIQPLVVTDTLRTEATLDYGYQNSQTDFLGIHWVDDTVKSYTAGFSMTNYGASTSVSATAKILQVKTKTFQSIFLTASGKRLTGPGRC